MKSVETVTRNKFIQNIAFCYFWLHCIWLFLVLTFFLNITGISMFSWIERLIFHRLHILVFQMLSTETRNQGKKSVVRANIWIRPMEREVHFTWCTGPGDLSRLDVSTQKRKVDFPSQDRCAARAVCLLRSRRGTVLLVVCYLYHIISTK